ncbi:hypothetical protein LBW62_21190 [Ralstonia solanacearum]|uniref:hypothetical protein n=1 Tax=Ralstonia solanacearum TaxID=305 RepID=UPI000A83AD8B|nr:hypothetical protein [Ralstonia solanacearum]MDB0509392.1 hypothetical protein [Ralstonia solanacearum]MDB0515323.1 hypothetical protein [Ralstonia solanacearum]MDB0528906.1 hypothetical protein [Ralstonia solanacearum]MDB0543742.1 hypothetical protein [Ralstonia solanacearum]MDB0552007.1 hypothetical protein [Ralstonia solanacearum]
MCERQPCCRAVSPGRLADPAAGTHQECVFATRGNSLVVLVKRVQMLELTLEVETGKDSGQSGVVANLLQNLARSGGLAPLHKSDQ